jgi:hypothetical protein
MCSVQEITSTKNHKKFWIFLRVRPCIQGVSVQDKTNLCDTLYIIREESFLESESWGCAQVERWKPENPLLAQRPSIRILKVPEILVYEIEQVKSLSVI